MSQDTGMAMTLIGYRGFTRRPSHRRDRPSVEELQAPMMRQARTRSMGRIAGRGGLPDPPARRASDPHRPPVRGRKQDSDAKTAARRRRAGGHGSARQPEPTARAFPTRRTIRSHSSGCRIAGVAYRPIYALVCTSATLAAIVNLPLSFTSEARRVGANIHEVLLALRI